MAINFKQISWQNFLSTGNAPNTIQLNRAKTTLIIGKNGEGKSTILDAITFALFGKPFRNINKPQLVNSINGKKCLVDLEFDIGTTRYRVVRGLKPNVFEVYCNDQLLNQDAAAKDYQEVLEKQILKLSYKTFTQVVILGSAAFVPFMQLPAAQRRSVIEDILDISVFSTMNTLLKDKIADNKEQIKDIDNKIEISKNNVAVQKKLIDTIVSSRKDQIAQIQGQINDNDAIIVANDERIASLTSSLQAKQALVDKESDIDEKLKSAQKAINKLNVQQSNKDEVIEFFEENTICPSCAQGIPHEHKSSILDKIQSERTEIADNLKVVESAYDKIVEKQRKVSELNKEISLLNTQIYGLVTSNNNIAKQNKTLNKAIEEANNDTSNVDAEKNKLKQIAADAMELINKKNELLESKQIQDIASLLLKDSGVKTAIIREYLPVMNKLINGYLSAMDFYVHFELDESFNEVIKSRYRDEFSYASFSEGEKMRIDLAILFTWRQIAKMKNSVNTNLLLLDEIFDSSLDVAGTDYFLNIINSIQDKTNIFVISHKGDQLFDKFHSVIRVEKKNDFSVIA